ncbi:MAG: hypothetical protein ACI91G_001365 [Gammaproteobacteria bacterium]|jgi:uncharacterized protein (DUF2147 family)
MKNMAVGFAALLMLAVNGAIFAEDITGRWLTESKDAYVEIKAHGNIFTGTIVGSPDGAKSERANTDSNNPDESLRRRPLVGLPILTDLKRMKSNLWEGGAIYDPNKSESYDCKVWLEDGVLMLRGYKGMFYRTSEWIRVATAL